MEKKSKLFKIAAVVCSIVVIAVITFVAFKLGERLANVEEDIAKEEKKELDEYANGLFDSGDTKLKQVKVTDLPEDVIFNDDNIDDSVEIKASGYDGYYIVKKDDEYYLNRNKKEIVKLEKNKFLLYKDKSDNNSKYIVAYCDEYCYLGDLRNGDYAYLNVFGKGSYIYNVDTGKFKEYKDDHGSIAVVEGNKGTHFVYEGSQTGVISLDAFSIITEPKDITIVGDSTRLSKGDTFYSNSSKYIVVYSGIYLLDDDNRKYGLYDYNLNKKIDCIYDDLVTISEDLLIAVKNGKFGVIDVDNKTIIDFKYDGIQAIGDYYVVLLDGKIGVIDQTGKEIVPLKFETSASGYSLRLCCGDRNFFYATMLDNQILIGYADATKSDDGNIYPVYDSYILLKSDGTYQKLDYANKIYNFSNEYYYFEESKDNTINVYDSNKNLYTSINCNGKDVYSINFVDREHIQYSCSIDEENEITYYYNIKDKKEVSYLEVDKTYQTPVDELVEYLEAYLVNGKYEIYNDKNRLLLTIDKDDKFEKIDSNTIAYYYKLTKKSGDVYYYKLD